MFVMLYRWTLKPGTEATFRTAWQAMTLAIQARSGTGGSRLHRADDGDLVAYAVWPSRAAWEAASALPSAHPEAGVAMRECIAASHPATPLDVLDDLIRPLPGAP
jgi:heme-degrading monooxygenase HmoA